MNKQNLFIKFVENLKKIGEIDVKIKKLDDELNLLDLKISKSVDGSEESESLCYEYNMKYYEQLNLELQKNELENSVISFQLGQLN